MAGMLVAGCFGLGTVSIVGAVPPKDLVVKAEALGPETADADREQTAAEVYRALQAARSGPDGGVNRFEWSEWLEILHWVSGFLPDDQQAILLAQLREAFPAKSDAVRNLGADRMYWFGHNVRNMDTRRTAGVIAVDWVENSPRFQETEDQWLPGIAWLVSLADERKDKDEPRIAGPAKQRLIELTEQRFFDDPRRMRAFGLTHWQKLCQFLQPMTADQKGLWANELMGVCGLGGDNVNAHELGQAYYWLRLKKDERNAWASTWLSREDIAWGEVTPGVVHLLIKSADLKDEGVRVDTQRVVTAVLEGDRLRSGECSIRWLTTFIGLGKTLSVEPAKIQAAVLARLEVSEPREAQGHGPAHANAGLLSLVEYARKLKPGDATAPIRAAVFERALDVGAQNADWLIPAAESNISSPLYTLYQFEIQQGDGDTPRLYATLNNLPDDVMLLMQRIKRTPSPEQAKQAIYNPYWAREGTDAPGFGRKLKEGLVVGELKPKAATLALLAWQMRSMGELDDWKLYLDDRITSAEKPVERVDWLIGRAYAEEITEHECSPLGGQPWLRQALAESPDEATRLYVVTGIFLRYLSVGDGTGAASFITSIEGQFIGDSAKSSFEEMAKLIAPTIASQQRRAHQLKAAHASVRSAGRAHLLKDNAPSPQSE